MEDLMSQVQVDALDALCVEVHQDNVRAGWWTDPRTGADLRGVDELGRDKRNVPEMLALAHSELSEGLEGYRKGLMDDKLPQFPMLEVEIADTIIRLLDLAGSRGYRLGTVIRAKRAFNARREDHRLENRVKAGGKSI